MSRQSVFPRQQPASTHQSRTVPVLEAFIAQFVVRTTRRQFVDASRICERKLLQQGQQVTGPRNATVSRAEVKVTLQWTTQTILEIGPTSITHLTPLVKAAAVQAEQDRREEDMEAASAAAVAEEAFERVAGDWGLEARRVLVAGGTKKATCPPAYGP